MREVCGPTEAKTGVPVVQLNSGNHSITTRLWWRRLTDLASDEGITLPELNGEAGESVRALAKHHAVPSELQSRATASVLEIDYLSNLTEETVLPQFVEQFPIAFARRHEIVALRSTDGTRHLAMSDVRSWYLLDVVRRLLDEPVQPVFAPAEEIVKAINDAYQQQSGQVQNLIESLDHDTLEAVGRLTSAEDLLDVADRPPVIKLVNLILFEAVQAGASDIHIQPSEQHLTVRLRMTVYCLTQ